MPPMCGQVLHKRSDAETHGLARGAGRHPSGEQGGGLPHPPGDGTEIPVACTVHPAPPPPGGRPRGGPEGRRGGVWNGPGSRRCSPSRVRLHGTGPPGPPVAPPGSGLPTTHGPNTPSKPGCSGGPRSDADTGQLTAGGRGARCPLAPLLEPLQRPRPTRPVLPGHTPTTPGAGGLYR